MDSLKRAIKNITQAESIVQKKKAISQMSLLFYTICRQEGMEQEDIINLTTQIIECFINDLNYLRNKVNKKNRL